MCEAKALAGWHKCVGSHEQSLLVDLFILFIYLLIQSYNRYTLLVEIAILPSGPLLQNYIHQNIIYKLHML